MTRLPQVAEAIQAVGLDPAPLPDLAAAAARREASAAQSEPQPASSDAPAHDKSAELEAALAEVKLLQAAESKLREALQAAEERSSAAEAAAAKAAEAASADAAAADAAAKSGSTKSLAAGRLPPLGRQGDDSPSAASAAALEAEGLRRRVAELEKELLGESFAGLSFPVFYSLLVSLSIYMCMCVRGERVSAGWRVCA